MFPLVQHGHSFTYSNSADECSTEHPEWLGDGYCDDAINTAECLYDYGDCCEESCVSSTYTCGINGFDCVNPGMCYYSINSSSHEIIVFFNAFSKIVFTPWMVGLVIGYDQA